VQQDSQELNHNFNQLKRAKPLPEILQLPAFATHGLMTSPLAKP
jgi:hypothetical protein